MHYFAPTLLLITVLAASQQTFSQGLKARVADGRPRDRQQQAQTTSKPTELTGEARRKYDTLMLIIEDADKAKLDTERKSSLWEFLAKSEIFVRANPKQRDIWVLRAAAALEVDEKFAGWEAGRKLGELGAENSSDPKIRRVLAMLDRKGWLKEKQWPKVQPNEGWENSLGMKFKPVGGVLFCIWETRLRDFEVFVNATGYDANEGMWSIGDDGWKQRGNTWKKPGFDQTPNHPVCGVSWTDAKAFCRWLTDKERAAGLLSADQSYRLPTDAEWSQAAGGGKYPWGDQWPPPSRVGNYADSDSGLNSKLENYHDGFRLTAPVGSFSAHNNGLFDIGGNVWEWCEDWYRKEMNTDEARKEFPALNEDFGGSAARVLRGAAWVSLAPVYLSSAYRYRRDPGHRRGTFGFRCVLGVGGGSR